jgi:hypothetical protein
MSMDIEFDTTRKSIPQGDVYLVPIKTIPSNAVAVSAEGGNYIITHSETGHHHVVMDRPDVHMFGGMDIFRGFLNVGNEPVDLVHLREVHKHESQTVLPGAWLIQRQAAHTLQGWERARD